MTYIRRLKFTFNLNTFSDKAVQWIIILFHFKVKLFCSNYFFQKHSYQFKDAGIVFNDAGTLLSFTRVTTLTARQFWRHYHIFWPHNRHRFRRFAFSNFSAQTLHTEHDKYAANAVDGHFKLAANMLLLSLKTVVMTNYLPKLRSTAQTSIAEQLFDVCLFQFFC